MRAIRGATTALRNEADAIAAATCDLLAEITRRNGLRQDEIVSVFFTLTPDLDAAFPARAARDMGWTAPMLDMQQAHVQGALQRCIRVLIHVDRMEPVRHVYLADARSLRPDIEEER